MATNKSGKSTKSAAKSTKKPAAKPKTVATKATQKQSASKKRQLKAAPVSVREQANMAASKSAKQSKRGVAFRILSRPFILLFQAISIIVRPFAFLLIPFRTRPARAIGRFLTSVLFLRYFRNSWKELRQVQWPNARETTKLTLAVFAFAIFFSLIVSLADWAIGNVVEKLIIN